VWIEIMRGRHLALGVWMMSFRIHRTLSNHKYPRTQRTKWFTTWMNRIRQVSEMQCLTRNLVRLLVKIFNHLKNPSRLFLMRLTSHVSLFRAESLDVE
jgi:hypothetical protein